ncbi:hypothetical protein ACU4GD_21210 [Cupriavidus basilensis]
MHGLDGQIRARNSFGHDPCSVARPSAAS